MPAAHPPANAAVPTPASPAWTSAPSGPGRQMMYYLIVAKGQRKGLPIPIQVDLFLLGSEPICQLRSDHLSPKHCAMVTRDKKVLIRAMDSAEPTLLNGEVIPPGDEWVLHAGDMLNVGPHEFMIQM